MLRIGHKGADAEVRGNTLASFQRAVEIGVEMIEIDLLWRGDEIVIAHDPEDAASREPLSLDECLEAFTESPLDLVQINLDIKSPERAAEAIERVYARGLEDRTTCSGLDIPAIDRARAAHPHFRYGRTYPLVRTRAQRVRWTRPFVYATWLRMRHALPAKVADEFSGRDVHALWVHHSLVTAKLREVTADAGAKLMAWTVDEAKEVSRMRALGVDGICSNDPRLLTPNVAQ